MSSQKSALDASTQKTSFQLLKALSPLDIVTIFYIVISTLYMCIGASKLQDMAFHILVRVAILGLIGLLAFLNHRYSNGFMSFIKNLYPLIFISFFYTETSYLKNIFIGTNLDAQVAHLESYLWGCQPSILFSENVPQPWFCELMNICYFSYYLITSGVCLAIYFKNRAESYESIFIVICSFYLYYIVFALIPVAGPQFFFEFTEAEPPYLFGKIMHYILINAEEPTGAFPSSHVGVSLVLSYIAFKHQKMVFYISLPFVIGICFATVYLKAHYLVDVIGAFISVPIFIAISTYLYQKLLSLSRNQRLGSA
jgi:membrane-associated phospholipid phosphatase